ncbi:hypothetical protein CLV24_1143 [Pontibacter ummariensis]|uniref:Ammonia monooxygenase n=1 Tax=Pontibacter ummariensis TaxID=1610492 RepID=A0A239HJE8_9BACT|nr:DUF6527 family protein [Pontibacter ummariensis]PRY10275.1 hypothetical protein CLV24_1143 [Pontibacter ummariensis]SNS81178.1 hypothetical protein SAMN06296052_1143 [Pontibacter ummariensis]
MKVEPILNGSVHTHLFFCPGCNTAHGFSDKVHTYNGDGNKPTIRASLLIGSQGGAKYLCHSFVRDGKIQFLSDCTHKLAGQTVELPEL